MPDSTTLARFWSKVDKRPDGCWHWTAYRQKHRGYGLFWPGGPKATTRMVLAHRWAYEALRGSVPDGTELDHRCRVRHCVNPDHLVPVTHTENVRLGVSGEVNGRRQRAKTHCPQGHPYDEQNTYHAPGGSRQCKTCRRAHLAALRARRRGL